MCSRLHRNNPPLTLAGHQAIATSFYAGFPDLQHTIEETVADLRSVAVRFTMRGTHTGEFMGIPPTNRTFEAGAPSSISSTAESRHCSVSSIRWA